MAKGENMRLAECEWVYSCTTDNTLCDPKPYNPLCLPTYSKIRPEVTKKVRFVDAVLTQLFKPGP